MESPVVSSEASATPEADQYSHYRSLSFSAIVTLVFSLISLPAVLAASLNAGLLVFPLIGMMIGLFSFLKLRNRTDEFTGLGAAKVGLLLSTVLFFSGAAFVSIVYATEVPEGYQRISFVDLQPGAGRMLPFSQAAEEVNTQKVFIKGYVYPDGQADNIKQFVLVPDMGTCCFGGQPKLTDMIQVTLEDPLRVEYSYYPKKLAGVFHIGNSSADKVGRVIYHLDANYVR